MATIKKTSKKTSTPQKKVTKPKPNMPKPNIETLAVETLHKLQALDLSPELQANLEWCLGSYRHDKQPSGLILYLNQSVSKLRQAVNRRTKGINTAYVNDLAKSIKQI